MSSHGWDSFVRDAGEATALGLVAAKKPELAAGLLIAKTVMGFLFIAMFIALLVVIIAHSEPVKNTDAGKKVVQATAMVKARMFAKKNGAEDQY